MLVIKKYIAEITDDNLFSLDFTFCCDESLTDSTRYDRGRKTETNYFSINQELAVKKIFKDIYEKNTFKGIDILISWYDTYENVVYSKKIKKLMGTGVAFDYLRKRRQRTISYLQTASIGTPIESYVLTLLKHYKGDVDLFIQSGSSDFETAVTTEQNTQINAMLDIVIDAQGKTVRDSILYQIT
tara:strand:- start:3258 stop:3812 length:555 start_codon:yes stop_codon:yes gene_type:complete